MKNGLEGVYVEPIAPTPTRKEIPVPYTLVREEPRRQQDMDFDSGESLVLRISKDSRARIDFSGQITQEAIANLTAQLNLTKNNYPTQDELNARSRRSLSTSRDPSPHDLGHHPIDEE